MLTSFCQNYFIISGLHLCLHYYHLSYLSLTLTLLQIYVELHESTEGPLQLNGLLNTMKEYTGVFIIDRKLIFG